jgi:hypothetical protein
MEMIKTPLSVAAVLALCLLSGAAAADELIDAETCKYLAVYKPAPDVDYKPGVDVHGHPVVEADITPPAVKMPENFSFDVNVDVAQAAGLPLPAGTQALAKVGTITYEKGELKFNGKPLNGEEEAHLKALCNPPESPSK